MDKQIDENLRRVYSETASEPVPDRFMQLIDQLREQEKPAPDTEEGGDS